MPRRNTVGMLAAAFLWSSGCWVERDDTTFFVEDAVREIRVDSGDAELELSGSTQDWIRIELVRWWTIHRPRVDVDLHGDLLDVEYACRDPHPPCAAQLHVTLPPEIDVRVRADDGDVLLNDLEGELSILGDRSDVWGYGLESSRVYVETGDGDVTLRHDAAPAQLSVVTVDGDVNVTVPPGRYDLVLESGGGDVFISAEIQKEPASPFRLEITTEDGDIYVRSSAADE